MNINEAKLINEVKRILLEGKDEAAICQIEARAAVTGYSGYGPSTPINKIRCRFCGNALRFEDGHYMCTNADCENFEEPIDITPTETIITLDAFATGQKKDVASAGETGSIGALDIPKSTLEAIRKNWPSISKSVFGKSESPRSGQLSIKKVRQAVQAGALEGVITDNEIDRLSNLVSGPCSYCGGSGKISLKDSLEKQLESLKIEEKELEDVAGDELSKQEYLTQRGGDPSEPYRAASPAALLHINRSMADYIRRRLSEIDDPTSEYYKPGGDDELIDCPKCGGRTVTRFVEYRPDEYSELHGISSGDKLPSPKGCDDGDMFYLKGGSRRDGIFKFSKFTTKSGGKWTRFELGTPWKVFVDWFIHSLISIGLKTPDGERVRLNIDNMPITKVRMVDDEEVPMLDSDGKPIVYGGDDLYGSPHPLMDIEGIWNEPTWAGTKVRDVVKRLKLRVTGIGIKSDSVSHYNPLGNTNKKVQKNLITILRSKKANDPSSVPNKYGRYFNLKPWPSEEHEEEEIDYDKLSGVQELLDYGKVERDRNILVTTDINEPLAGEAVGLPAKPIAYTGMPNFARLIEKYEQDMLAFKRGVKGSKGASGLGEHIFSVMAKKIGLEPKLVNRLFTKLMNTEVPEVSYSEVAPGTSVKSKSRLQEGGVPTIIPDRVDLVALYLSELRKDQPRMDRDDFVRGNKTSRQIDREYQNYVDYIDDWEKSGKPPITRNEADLLMRKWLRVRVGTKEPTGTPHDILAHYLGLGSAERRSERSAKAAETMRSKRSEEDKFSYKSRLAAANKTYPMSGPHGKTMRGHFEDEFNKLRFRMPPSDEEVLKVAVNEYMSTAMGNDGILIFPRYKCPNCGFRWYQGSGNMCLECGCEDVIAEPGEFDISNFDRVKAAQALDIIKALGRDDARFMKIYNDTKSEMLESIRLTATDVICEELEEIKDMVLIPTIKMGKPYTEDVNFIKIFNKAQRLFESLVKCKPSIRVAKAAPMMTEAPILDPKNVEFWMNIIGALNEDDLSKYKWDPAVLQNVRNIGIMIKNIRSYSNTVADLLVKLIDKATSQSDPNLMNDTFKTIELIHNKIAASRGNLSREEWDYIVDVAKDCDIDYEILDVVPMRGRKVGRDANI